MEVPRFFNLRECPRGSEAETQTETLPSRRFPMARGESRSYNLTNMSPKLHSLLGELKAGLQSLYAGRLHGIYLYGSHARGQGNRESGVDILIVLDEVPSYAAEVDRTGKLIVALSLKYAASVSRVFVSRNDWLQGQSPFLLNAREEAIAA